MRRALLVALVLLWAHPLAAQTIPSPLPSPLRGETAPSPLPSPETPQALLERGLAHLQASRYLSSQEDLQAAWEAFHAAHDNLGESRALLGLARCQEQLSRPAQAQHLAALALPLGGADERVLARCLQQLPEEPEPGPLAPATLVQLNLSRAHSHSEPRPFLEAALGQAGPERLQVLLEWAELARARGDQEEAGRRLREAAREGGGASPYWTARLLELQGDEASLWGAAALHQQCGNLRGQAGCLKALAHKLGSSPQGLSAGAQALELYRQDRDVAGIVACGQERVVEDQQLEPVLRQALEEMPEASLWALLARVLSDRNQDQLAEEAFHRALQMSQGQTHLTTLVSYSNWLSWKSRGDESVTVMQEALAYRQGLGSSAELEPAPVLRMSLAERLFEVHRSQDALEQQRQAVQEVAGDSPQERLAYWNHLLTMQRDSYQIHQAQLTLREVLRAIPSLASPQARGRAYGQLFSHLQGGGLDRLLLAREAGQVRQAFREWLASSPPPPEQASAYQSLAEFLLALGQQREAMDALAHAHLADPRLSRSPGLLRLARYQADRGQVEKALELLRGGLSLEDRDLLVAISELEARRGHWQACLDRLDEALSNQRDDGLLIRRGQALLHLGRAPEAAGDYQEAADGVGRRHLLESRGRALVGLGQSLQALGQVERAAQVYQEARTLLPAYQRLELALSYGPLLSDTQALELYQETLASLLDLQRPPPSQPLQPLLERTLKLLHQLKRDPEVLQWVERARAADTLASLDLSDDPRLAGLVRLRADLGALQSQPANDHPEALQHQLSSIRDQFFAQLNQVRQQNPDFEQLLSVQVTDLARLQQRLPAGCMVVQYYLAQDCLYLMTLTRGGYSLSQVAVGRERLDQLVRQARAAWSSPNAKGGFAAPLAPPAIAKGGFAARLAPPAIARQPADEALSGYLLGPLQSELKSHPQLFVIPSGSLWYLPFEALHVGSKGYLVERSQVSYLGSVDALRLSLERDSGSAPPVHLLALGADLPDSLLQVRALASQLLTGPRATAQGLRSGAARADILQLASHRHLDSQDVSRSYLKLSGGNLRLSQVYSLHLKPHSLVVLSACETALGHGRELASLATAFSTAGAASLVATLWKVDDRSPAAFFISFYQGLKKGISRAQALRQAKLQALRDPARRAPYCWAAYTLLGDPR